MISPVTLPTKELVRGDSFAFSHSFKYGNGDPMPLNVFTGGIFADVRAGNNQYSPLLFSMSLESGLAIEGDDNEILTGSLTPDKTKLFPMSGYYYTDFRFITGDGDVYTFINTKFKITSNTTEV